MGGFRSNTYSNDGRRASCYLMAIALNLVVINQKLLSTASPLVGEAVLSSNLL